MIYFIQSSNGLIKIGYSASVMQRLRNLQTASSEITTLLGTIGGNRTREKDIHNKFSHLKVRGEWFKPEQELLDFIKVQLLEPKPKEQYREKVVCLPRLSAIMVNVGENIKFARIRRKLTANMVAERAGISRPTLRAIERGDAGVMFGNLANVLLVLGLEKDLSKLAQEDTFGRQLQDSRLPKRVRSSKKR